MVVPGISETFQGVSEALQGLSKGVRDVLGSPR